MIQGCRQDDLVMGGVKNSDNFKNLLNNNENFIGLKIFNKNGLPLFNLGKKVYSDDIMHGGFLAAVTIYADLIFQVKLKQLIFDKFVAYICTSKNLIGWLVLKVNEDYESSDTEMQFKSVIEHIERNFIDIESKTYDLVYINSQIEQLLYFE